jgi:hypothetical protein
LLVLLVLFGTPGFLAQRTQGTCIHQFSAIDQQQAFRRIQMQHAA